MDNSSVAARSTMNKGTSVARKETVRGNIMQDEVARTKKSQGQIRSDVMGHVTVLALSWSHGKLLRGF